jgi:hypothetical protein
LERLKTILLLALLLSGFSIIFAQGKGQKQEFNTLLNSNPETLFLHINATVFVTGETLQYKLYSLKPAAFVTSPVSQIAYVELIDEDLKRIFIQKLNLENGIGQGDFFVPTTLKTGNYKLIAYTYWMLNKPVTELYQLNLSIINPFQKNEKIVANNLKEFPSLEKDKKTKDTEKKLLSLDNKKTEKHTTPTLSTIENKQPIKSSKKAETTTASKFVDVELIGEDSKSIFTQKLTLENGIAQGNLFIPSNIKMGNYKLIVNTNSKANNATSTPTQVVLPVINPYQKDESVAKTATKDIPSIEKVENTEKEFPALEKEKPINNNQVTVSTVENSLFSLLLDKKTVPTREKFVFKINTATQQIQKGNYSISVRKTDQLTTGKQLTATEFKNKWLTKSGDYDSTEKEIIVPELRGEIITGSVSAKNGSSSIQNKNIALSIPGKSFTFKTTNTNTSGKFMFNLDKTNTGSNLVIQIIDEDREKYTVQLEEPREINYSLLQFKSNFNLSPDMKNSILQRSVARQIENAYYNKKADSIVVSNTTDNFFKNIAKEYILDDYTRFSTLQETITEVLFEVYYKQSENNFTIGVRDFDTNFESPGSTLVLVDGLLIQDFKELFNYSTKNIYKVSIITGGYYYGSKLFNGVISFTTFRQDYVSKQSGAYKLETKILRPVPKKEYFTPDYTNKLKNKRIPDYRYQLLWLPQITLANTENPISFYTSDVTGTFEITLEGFTDQGIPVSLKNTFEVK